MRTPATITREIQEVDSLFLTARKFSTDFPEDKFLRMNLEDLAYRKKTLLAELQQSLIANNQHALQYIFKTSTEQIEVKTLTTNLAALSRLMDAQMDTNTSGKRRKTHLPILFNTVFSGSFGIQLSTPAEDKFLDQDYEKAVGGTLHSLAELTTAADTQLDEVVKRTFAHEAKLLNRFTGLLNAIAHTGQDVEIRWHSPVTDTVLAVQVTPDKAQQLVQVFEKQATQEYQTTMQGVIKGVSLLRNTIELVHDPEGREFIKADFDKALSDLIISALNRLVVARLLVTTAYSEARDEPKLSYRLLALDLLN